MGHRGFNNYFFPYELAMKLFLAGLNTLNNEKKRCKPRNSARKIGKNQSNY